MNFLKNDSGNIDFYRVVTLVLVIAVIFFGYQFAVVQPRESRNAAEARLAGERLQEEMDEQKRQESLDSCISDAEMTYSLNWDSSCESTGLEPDCRLPMTQVNRWDELRAAGIKLCQDRYGN